MLVAYALDRVLLTYVAPEACVDDLIDDRFRDYLPIGSVLVPTIPTCATQIELELSPMLVACTLDRVLLTSVSVAPEARVD